MNIYTKLAKSAVEKFVKEKDIIQPPENLPKDFFTKKAGVFVTIKKDKNLRACIGTPSPAKSSICEEIIHNAVAAASKDYRFGPVKEEELPFLSYEVYILNKPEPVKSLEELNPLEYGIIVRGEKYKTGLLLPGLEGINTPEEQVSVACKKAGIDTSTEEISLYRFRAKKYKG